MTSSLPAEPLLTSATGHSNEAKLRLLEKRLQGQDVVSTDLRRFDNVAGPAQPTGRMPITDEPAHTSQPCTTDDNLTAQGAQLQPGSHAPRQPLQAGQHLKTVRQSQKRKRLTSPTETQRPTAAGQTFNSTPAVGRVSGNGQTTLNAYFPVVDGSSRDSEVSHGALGGPVQLQPMQQPINSPRPDAIRTNNPASKELLRGSTGSETCTGKENQSAPAAAAAISHNLGVGKTTGMPVIAASPCNQQASADAAIQGLAPPSQLQHQQATISAQHLRTKNQELEHQLANLRQQLRQCTEAATKRNDELVAEAAAAVSRAEALAADIDAARQTSEEREAKVRFELTRLISAAARDKHELTRLQLSASAIRLGSIAVQRNGLTLQEVWEEGQAASALATRKAALTTQREDVEAARKALRKKLAPPPTVARSMDSEASTSGRTGSAPTKVYMDGLEFVTQDEILKMRLAVLQREEDQLKEEADRIAAEKSRYVRSIKRLRDEEGSRFGCGKTVLGNRFVLLNMLGKGGFSEVFKAYDLRDLCVVAVKIHQLNPGWSEARKASYVKHAIREVDIQKALRHKNIVGLIDILEVDAHCFATVLEFCEGGDLDGLLKEHQVLPEAEARSIISQVMAGLQYLNQPGRRIIHYDLKPANILFDALGAAKITDFGLSKVVEDGATMGLELTSQGAGTYWYLPPECFEMGGPHAPRITNKVDVWSVGVILYQMLFGRRPYGEGLSQEAIVRDRVMLGARQVEFPAQPVISPEAKQFINKCLALRAENRWDVAAAASDEYLAGNRKAVEKA